MPLIVFNPSIAVFATSDEQPTKVGSGGNELEVPFVLKAGQMVSFPAIQVGSPHEPRDLRVALRTATGEVIRARPVSKDALLPFYVKTEGQHAQDVP